MKTQSPPQTQLVLWGVRGESMQWVWGEGGAKQLAGRGMVIIGASLIEPHTRVTALHTRVSIRLTIYLWTDHLPEILNLRICEISKCTSERA